MTLTDGIERFCVQLEADGRSPHTRRTYRRHLDAFARWAGGDTALADITPDRLARFLTSDAVRMRADAEGAGPRAAITVNQVKSALRAFFRYIVEVGTLAMSPARAVRSARTSSDLPQVLTQDEAARLLGAMGDRGLVGNGQRPHPAAQDAERVDDVVRLRAAIGLPAGEGAALGRSHGADGKRDPVDLVLEDAGDGPLHLGA